MDDNTPIQPQNKTEAPSHTIGIIALVCFLLVLPIALIPYIGIVASLVLNTLALILGIIAVVKKSTALGVITICLTILIGFPGGCILGGASTIAATAAAPAMEIGKLGAKIAEAEAKGDQAAVEKYTKELEDLTKKYNTENEKSVKEFQNSLDDLNKALENADDQ